MKQLVLAKYVKACKKCHRVAWSLVASVNLVFKPICLAIHFISIIHGTKRSAVASRRRYDLSPERSVSCQLQSVSHQYSCIPADSMNTGNGRSTLSTLPVR